MAPETATQQGKVGSHAPEGGQQRPTGIDPKTAVPLSVVTDYFRNHAKRAVSNNEKKWLYDFAEGLGPAIVNNLHGPGSITTQEFMTACGIDPHWGNVEN
jgi:hypothetical protein